MQIASSFPQISEMELTATAANADASTLQSSFGSLLLDIPPIAKVDSPLPRLLYVATSKNNGGIERYSVQLAARLARQGSHILFACMPGEIVERMCRNAYVPTVSLTIRNSGDLRATLRLARIIMRERIELVHVHSRRDYLPAILAVMLARTRGHQPRLVLHMHLVRSLGSRATLIGDCLFRRQVDAIIAVSSAVKSHLMAIHGLTTEFVRVIFNGIDLDEFALPHTTRACKLRKDVRQEWNIAPEAPLLVMVGRLNAKGQEPLLNALLAASVRVPNLHVMMIGSEENAGLADRLSSKAALIGSGFRLLLTGPREDVPALLTASDIMIHIPAEESFGLAIAEGMAAGLPVIASNTGGCREVVQDGITGILVAPDDQDALLQALLRLLQGTEPGLIVQMGSAGRARAEQMFSFSNQFDSLKALYRELCPAYTTPQ